jgi:putative NIF3 family GTP cyclohydrolase 1 type 2
MIPEKPFAPYFGGLAGVFGKTSTDSVQELKSIFEKTIEHKASLYNYGSEKIKDGKVAVVAGGGLDECIREVAEYGINVFVTGITAKNSHSQKAHDFAEASKINLLGGTHYSTEKFACIAMCGYFKKLGLPSKFIPDKPIMEDL